MHPTHPPILVDRSEDFLSGNPIAVTLILSDTTWDGLTKNIDDIRRFGGLEVMPLDDRIEAFLIELTDDRCYSIDDEAYNSDGDLDQDNLF